MTEPTNKELDAVIKHHRTRIYPQDMQPHFERAIMRAGLAKWGQPAQVVDCALEGERTVSRDGRTVEASVNPHRQPAPATQQAGEVRPVTPYTCPKCHALWLHWPAEQTGFGRDTLNCRSADHCHYCEKAGVEQLQRLERISAALHAPQPSPTVQAAESVPAPPPECETEAEKRAFAFGWFKALESERMKAESVLEDAARYRWLFGARTEAQSACVPETVFKPLPQDEVLSHLQGFYMSKPVVDALVDAARKQGASHDNS
jgi:hypothetical protein